MELKDKKNDSKLEESASLAKKRHNDFNRFLNQYFKYFIVALIFIFLWASIRFVLQPKFEKAVFSSNQVLKEKKNEFLSEYNRLQNYREAISVFSEIEAENVYKINKIIPSKYSREDLFTEITYFVIKNNFQLKSVNITDPQSNESTISSGLSSRRQSIEQQIEAPAYTRLTSMLPSNLNYFVVELEFLNIDYPALKYLLDIMENNLRIIDIYSLNFNPIDKTASIGFLTYYQK